jgi:hypothetical protein
MESLFPRKLVILEEIYPFQKSVILNSTDKKKNVYKIKNKCASCGKYATLRCQGCKKVYYCSENHQKLEWKNHKKSCKNN